MVKTRKQNKLRKSSRKQNKFRKTKKLRGGEGKNEEIFDPTKYRAQRNKTNMPKLSNPYENYKKSQPKHSINSHFSTLKPNENHTHYTFDNNGKLV